MTHARVPPSLGDDPGASSDVLGAGGEEGRDEVASPEGAAWSPRLTRHLYAKQTVGDGRVILGGDRRTHPPVGFGGRLHALPRLVDSDGEASASNWEHACSLLPGLAASKRERVWSGLMSFSPDGRPLVGRVRLARDHATGNTGASDGGSVVTRPSLPSRLYAIGGFGAAGFMSGAFAGKLLADVIFGDLHGRQVATCDAVAGSSKNSVCVGPPRTDAECLCLMDPNRFVPSHRSDGSGGGSGDSDGGG